MDIKRFSEISELIGSDTRTDYIACPCGCGSATSWNNATGLPRFKPGHDAKLVSKILDLIRAQNPQITAQEGVEFLRVEGYEKLSDKLSRHLAHLPKNGPTRKAARKLIAEVGMPESKWIERACPAFSGDYHRYHTETEHCALVLVLHDVTASRIFRMFS